jgi:hypothetical protein
MKVKARVPKKLEKTYTRCVDIGEAISKATCHLGVVMEVVVNKTVERRDPFTWRNLSGTLQGLHDLKKKAPELGAKIEKVTKDTEGLRGLIYRTPSQKQKIYSKYRDVLNGVHELRAEVRGLCSDLVKEEKKGTS